MSNQLQITGGAKVRNLNGVITGTTGVLGSVPLGAANGVATLDSGGKVPVSQLPASVVTYLGTWNAATNTPTLVNGTGDPGDLYICNVAGTVNFGAGPISFVVGDWVLYGSGTWQKSSGQNGTVTSVAVTETGDALTITGSPITTAGTINIGFAGTSAQYVAGNGSLITFPSLTGYVPYTGATQTLDMGEWDVNARGFKVNGTAGNGHVDFKHQSGTPTGSASSTTLFANVDGNLAWKNDHNYITTLASNANTADRVYTLQNASGTLAFLSDIPSLAGYVTLAGTQTISGTKTFTATTTTSKIRVDNTLLSEGTTVAFKQYESGAIGETGYTSLAAQSSNLFYINWGGTKSAILDSVNLTADRTYTLPNASGTLALTSDIPSLTGYVTLATTQTITGAKTFNNNLYIDTNAYWTKMNPIAAISGTMNLYAPLGSSSSFVFLDGDSSKSARFNFDNTANRTYTFPTASGTIALTSDIPSLSNYVTLDTTQTITGTKTFSGDVFALTGVFTRNTADTFLGSSNNTSGITVNGTSTVTKIVSGGNVVATFASTGAATFSSSVTAGGTSGVSGIFTSSNFFGSIDLENTGGTATGKWNLQAVSGAQVGGSAGSSFGIYSYGASAYRLFINSSGNVGIGTTSPTNLLTLVSAASNKGIDFVSYASLSTVVGSINFEQTNDILSIMQKTAYSGGALVLGTNSTERLRITSGGNVGIGTTSPYSTLHVNQGNTSATLVTVGNNNGGNLFGVNGGGQGLIATYGNADLIFGKNYNSSFAETMRITSGGYLKASPNGSYFSSSASFSEFCNNTTDTPALFLTQTSTSFTDNVLFIEGYTNTTNNTWYLISGYNRTAGAYKFRVADSGNVTNTNGSYGTISSDRRLKENIVSATTKLDDIMKLNVVNFNLIGNKEKHIGFIAQEMQEVFPSFVYQSDTREYDEDGNVISGLEDALGVKVGMEFAVLVKAIQELKQEIDELKNK